MNTYTQNVINVLSSLVNDSNKTDLLAAIEVIKQENGFEAKTLSGGVIMLEVGALADKSAPLYVIKLSTTKNELGLTKMQSLTIDKNTMTPQNEGETGSFTIDSKCQLKEVNYNLADYEARLTLKNQFYQDVTFYTPKNEHGQVIAVINGKQFLTGFYDCGDFKKDSDYLPVTYNGKVYHYYSYYYASSDYYYPKK